MKNPLLFLLVFSSAAIADDAVTQTALLQMQQNVQSINDAVQSQAVSSDPNLTPDQQQALVNEQIRRSQMTGQHVPPGYVYPHQDGDGVSQADNENGDRLQKLQAQQSPQVQQPQESAADVEADRQFAVAVKQSTKKAAALFPQLYDPGSPLHIKAKNIWKFLQDKGSPIANDPDAPYIVYCIAAAELDIKPAH